MLGVPVWEHDGIICTGETYKSYVKLTFAKGAALEDPAGLFNASLEGNVRRAIDIREGDKIDETAFKALVRAAVALNAAKPAKAATARAARPREQAEARLRRSGDGRACPDHPSYRLLRRSSTDGSSGHPEQVRVQASPR